MPQRRIPETLACSLLKSQACGGLGIARARLGIDGDEAVSACGATAWPPSITIFILEVHARGGMARVGGVGKAIGHKALLRVTPAALATSRYGGSGPCLYYGYNPAAHS